MAVSSSAPVRRSAVPVALNGWILAHLSARPSRVAIRGCDHLIKSCRMLHMRALVFLASGVYYFVYRAVPAARNVLFRSILRTVNRT